MDENMKSLFNKFKKIQEKGWIKSTTKSTGGIGITFEKELGNSENNSAMPDYKGIEIKCTSINSIYPLTLFSISLDGPTKSEMWRIVFKYGHLDKEFKTKKVFYSNLNCKKDYLVNDKYYFKYEIDYQEEKIYLVVHDYNYDIVERRSFINFSSIEKHLKLKLSNLAIIYGLGKCVKGDYYYKYKEMHLYKLNDFKTFLSLLDNDIINASMILRINKSNNHYGKSSSKNICFSIKKSNIEKLFTRIYTNQLLK